MTLLPDLDIWKSRLMSPHPPLAYLARSETLKPMVSLSNDMWDKWDIHVTIACY